MIPRSILVVTTSRADFGHLYSVARAIEADPDLELRLVVSGSHLDGALGATESEIRGSGLPIWERIPIHGKGGDESAALRAVGEAIHGIRPLLEEWPPDLMLILGDRTEIMAFALGALIFRIPLAHIHGGEVTAGAVDESIRHAVTKLATYHFPATQLYADNIAQLGEDPERIFLSGAPGLDRLLETDEITREALLADVAMDPALPTALVALHPVTTEDAASAGAMAEAVVKALVERGLQALFTGANADAHGQLINDYFQDVADHYPDRFRFRMHLGGFLFINAMRRLDIMVGNSSSGLIEAPSCKIPVVNIGDRQAGRVAAENVLHARPTPAAISEAIRQALSPQFRKVAREALNPYRPVNEVTAGEFIKEVLKRVSLDPGVLKKDFVTLER